MRFVVRVRIADNGPDHPPGVGYMTKDGHCTRELGEQTQIYDTWTDAWDHMVASGQMGQDEETGQVYAWIEDYEPGSSSAGPE